MAQLYQEVIAVTISRLVRDSDLAIEKLATDENLADIQDIIEGKLPEGVVVEAARIDDE